MAPSAAGLRKRAYYAAFHEPSNSIADHAVSDPSPINDHLRRRGAFILKSKDHLDRLLIPKQRGRPSACLYLFVHSSVYRQA